MNTSSLSNCTIGFLGSGNMAEAILRGLIERGSAEPQSILLSDLRTDRLAELRKHCGVSTASDNRQLLKQSTVVVLAVKPQSFEELARDLAGCARPDHVFISILAGIRADRIEAALAHDECPSPRVIRTMPNTPALVGAGATGISAGAHATNEDVNLAVELFSAVGVAEVVEPSLMDAITGLTGSGPAYVFRLIEALMRAAEEQGIPGPVADRLVKQMVWGSALLAKDSEHSPGELRRRVTSPGGTTAAGLAVLEERGFEEALVGAVDAAAKRGGELAG